MERDILQSKGKYREKPRMWGQPVDHKLAVVFEAA